MPLGNLSRLQCPPSLDQHGNAACGLHLALGLLLGRLELIAHYRLGGAFAMLVALGVDEPRLPPGQASLSTPNRCQRNPPLSLRQGRRVFFRYQYGDHKVPGHSLNVHVEQYTHEV